MKVADFNFQEVDADLREYMKAFAWYSDQMLNEDLYSPADAMDCDHFAKLPESAQRQLREMVELCKAQDCAYVRFIDQMQRTLSRRDQEALASLVSNQKEFLVQDNSGRGGSYSTNAESLKGALITDEVDDEFAFDEFVDTADVGQEYRISGATTVIRTK